MTTTTPFDLQQLTQQQLEALEAVAGKFSIDMCATPHGEYLLVKGARMWMDFHDLAELQQACASGDFSNNLIPF